MRIDLLLPSQLRAYSANPERLIEVVRAHPENRIIIIDEVQKVPELLSAVHYLIEEDPGKYIFILTGSSSRKIKRSGVDLLGGRAEQRRLYPFTPQELGQDFDISDALVHGLIPLVFMAADRTRKLRSYIDLYLKEEIKAEGYVKDLGAFTRFLEVMSFSHGEMVNLSNISRECEVERKSVERYVEILEDTLIAERLPVFTRRAKRATVTHAKFYFFDTGVFRALIPLGREEEGMRKGAALEGLVLQVLRASLSYSGRRGELCFWRTKADTEVDFILDFGSELVAIEVKSSRKIHRGELASLKSFKIDYPEARLYFVYMGSDKLVVDGITCIPAEQFLRIEAARLFS